MVGEENRITQSISILPRVSRDFAARLLARSGEAAIEFFLLKLTSSLLQGWIKAYALSQSFEEMLRIIAVINLSSCERKGPLITKVICACSSISMLR